MLPREAVSRPRMWPQLRSDMLRAVNAGGALHRTRCGRELGLAPERRHGDMQRREIDSSGRCANPKCCSLEVDGTEGCEAAGNG